MSPLPLVLALAAATPARILAVRVEEMGARHAIRIVAVGELGEVGVHREGPELVLVMTAEAPDGLSPPAPVGPIEAISIRREPPGVTVHVQVSPEVPFEVRREASLVTVLFGAGDGKTVTPSSDLAELYKLVFPASAIEGAEAPGQVAEAAGKGSEESGGGLGLGPFSFRPSVALSYINAKTTLLSGTPRPVSDDYIEVQPRLGTELSLWDGRFTADYEPKIRGYSSIPQAQKPSHTLNARLELPIAERLTLGASEHWVRGFLEVNDVDPGGEYFFQLGRFTRNQVGASARVEVAPRMGLDLGADFNQVRFDGSSSFFAYDSRGIRAGVYFEITPDLRSVLSYVYDRVPPPKERPEAESTAHGAQLALTGDILPLFTGAVSVGYRDQRSPRAAEGGQRFRGLTLGASLTKQFGRATSLELSASRATQLSAFEGNAFYVANTTQAELTLPLPLSVSLRGGAGYHWNEYKTTASGIGDRRKDRIFGWSAGLGRAFSRWAYLRADYRKDRRNSNLDVFDTETEAFTLQAGLGLFGDSRRR